MQIMKNLSISFRKTAFIILMSTGSISIISILGLWIVTEISKSTERIDTIKTSYLAEQRDIIKSEVWKVVDMINFSRKNNGGKTKQQLQDEILNYYSSVRINHGGYIFINSYEGNALIFDGVKIIGEKNIRNITDPDGLKIFDAELNAITNPTGDFFSYKFKKLNSTTPTSKISFVYGYDDWDWIIGAGVYLDELDLIIQQEKNKYHKFLYNKILHIIIVLILLLISLFVMGRFLSGFITREFNVFNDFLSGEINNDSLINDKILHIDEFVKLARQANNVITKQRATENQLKKERDKAHKYLYIAEVIILALNRKGVVTLINKKGCEIIGYDMEDIIGKNWFQNFIPIANREIQTNSFLNIINAEGTLDFKNKEGLVISKSGEERIISWQSTLLYDENGRLTGSLSSGRDITNKYLAEKSYHESEEKYKLLFEKTSDPVLLIGIDNTFVDCNQAAINILGMKSKQEILGLHPDKLSPEKQLDGKLSLIKASEMITKAKLDGFNRFEWLHKTINDTLFHVDVSLTAIPISGVEYLYVVWRDISKRIEQDDKLKVAMEKAEQSENVKTSFLHNMQHEIRTPLNAIMGFSQLLKDGVVDSKELQGYYDDIICSGNQLSKIIDEIIEFSRLQAGFILINNSNTVLKKLVCEVYKDNYSRATNKSIKFTIESNTSNSNQLIRADVGRVKRILDNLLDNAFKFTEDGKIELTYIISDNEIIFSIEDSGVGIDEKDIDSIFDKFNRITHKNPSKLYGGSGLGLSISKAILEQLNGRIWVESEVGKGSVFSFSVPYRPLEIDSNLQKQTFDNSNITVVTSDKAIFDIISRPLRKTEANIVHIVDGVAVVEYCQRNYKTNLILVDLNVLGMSGITTIKALRAFNQDLPIVALCPDDNKKHTKELALAAGCNSYLLMSEFESEIMLTLSVCLNKNILDERYD